MTIHERMDDDLGELGRRDALRGAAQACGLRRGFVRIFALYCSAEALAEGDFARAMAWLGRVRR